MDKKSKINNILEKLRNINRLQITKKANKKRFDYLKKNNIQIRKLTKEQKKSVDALYKKFKFKYSYETHELVYSVTGNFYPKVIPEDFYRICIDPKLNDYDCKHFLSDKNYFETYMPNLRFPKTIVHNIRGSFYDENYNLINKNEALNLIKRYDRVVIKPSNDSGFGRGVELVNVSDDVFSHRESEYIVQELLVQHPVFAALNESSVNIVRIVTVFINDAVYAVTAAMRIGGVGDFTDNVEHSDGSGMIVVGISKEGCLKDLGYHSNGTSVKQTPGGLVFCGYKIPKYSEMVETAKREHIKYPQIRFIAWDFTLDKDENIIVMEYNTKSPGVLYYQYTNGPLFGEATDEVLSFVEKQYRK